MFGGKLTALRWPEKELVSVPAKNTYADPVRPFMPVAAASLNAQQANDDLLNIEDVRGNRLVTTRLHRNVTIREEMVGRRCDANGPAGLPEMLKRTETRRDLRQPGGGLSARRRRALR